MGKMGMVSLFLLNVFFCVKKNNFILVEKARTIIEAVAEIDDDLSHPEKAESVLQRYSMLKDELNYV